MKNNVIFLILAVIVIAIFSCTTSTESDNNDIQGRIFDANGNPLQNAKVMLSYNIEIEENRPETVICFALAEDSHVKLWITKADESDTLLILMDEELSAGCHNVVWNGKIDDVMILNDFYQYHLSADGYNTSKYIFFNNNYYVTEENYEYNALTNKDGWFSIPQSNLPYNSELNGLDYFDENGNCIGTYSITRNVNFHATHSSYSTVAEIDLIYIDSENPQEIQLYFNQ